MGVSSRKGRKSHTGDKIGGIHGTANGVCLGGVGVRCGDGTTSSKLATSLVGSAGTGSTGSAQGIGVDVGIGSSRGVVTVKVLPSTYMDFTAKGEGTNKFICPLASKRGGIEIQSLSVSFGIFGVIIG